MEKTVKVSNGVYENVREIAATNGKSISEVADSLMRGSVEAFKAGVGKPADTGKLQETFDGIVRQQTNGMVYKCHACGYQFGLGHKPDECPECHAKIEWGKVPEDKINWVAIALAGIAALVLVSTLSKRQQTGY